jgi:hypothetical protein
VSSAVGDTLLVRPMSSQFHWMTTDYSFPSENFSSIPTGKGVYRWRIKGPKKPFLYIGQTGDCFHRRLLYYVYPNTRPTNLRVASWLRCARRHDWSICLDILRAPIRRPYPHPKLLEHQAIRFYKAQRVFTVCGDSTMALMKCFRECAEDLPCERKGCYMYRTRKA